MFGVASGTSDVGAGAEEGVGTGAGEGVCGVALLSSVAGVVGRYSSVYSMVKVFES
jgi:hypothetical protein